MKDIKQLSSALTETIENDSVQETLVEFSEVGFDTLLDDGILKDIPIIGSIYKLSKAALTIQDRLFINKLFSFLKNISGIPSDVRMKMISKIENSSDYTTKVGEKLLYIIDKCDDREKSNLIGILFKAYLKGNLSYDDFLRASKCIELTHLEDLKNFISLELRYMDFADAGDLVGSGLMTATFIPGELTYDGESKGKIDCKPSYIGKKIQELLK